MHKHFTIAVEYTCKNCGKQFVLSSNTRAKFCSFKCYNEYKARPDSEYRVNARVTLKCSGCGKEFERMRSQVRGVYNYCSRHCQGLASGNKMKKSRAPAIEKTCAVCGKTFKCRASNPNRRCCSKECAGLDRSSWMRGENNANFRHGQSRASTKGIASRHYAMKCIVCDFDVFVDIHHIHPLSKGGTNAPENLAVLCPNHHRMADRGMLSEDALRDAAQKARKT